MFGQPVFYYDLGSPQCYVVAETIMTTLPVVPEWEPVLGSDLAAGPDQVDREQIERQCRLGLQPIRWPRTWPPDTETAMLAATYAKRIGRAVAFSLAAFRQTFAGGRDLGDEDTILIAGAACEMHPTALRKGIELAGTETALQTAHAERARRRRHGPARDPGRRQRPRRHRGDRDGRRGPPRMRANRAYELIVSRGGREPAFLSDPDRTDRIEVVSVDDGEVILYWNLAPKDASKLLKLLRADLVSLDADEFFDKWLDADAEDF